MTVGAIWQVVVVTEAAPALWVDYRCRRVGQLIRHQLIWCLRDCCTAAQITSVRAITFRCPCRVTTNTPSLLVTFSADGLCKRFARLQETENVRTIH